jgi:uncharacterized damage-inducible protein DinB
MARRAETEPAALDASILAAWRTNAAITASLVANMPADLWDAAVPTRRTVRSILGHFHNSRAWWLKTLGREHGIAVPELVDVRAVTRTPLLRALKRSAAGIQALLRLGIDSGGQIPRTKAYVWRNLPLDVGHVLAYFVAHEAHHRGQLVLLARQSGRRLPRAVVEDLWQFTRRTKAN